MDEPIYWQNIEESWKAEKTVNIRHIIKIVSFILETKCLKEFELGEYLYNLPEKPTDKDVEDALLDYLRNYFGFKKD